MAMMQWVQRGEEEEGNTYPFSELCFHEGHYDGERDTDVPWLVKKMEAFESTRESFLCGGKRVLHVIVFVVYHPHGNRGSTIVYHPHSHSDSTVVMCFNT